jgi:hypothetical protein
MKRNLLAMLTIAGGLSSNLFAQNGPYQSSDPYYDNGSGYGQGGYQQGVYDQGGYGPGVYAPAPPPPRAYAYGRPPMPGPGYVWVDGYWNYATPRYQWVNGYWAMPPYPGGYWVAPRYTGNRFFVGFWGGGGGRSSLSFGFSGGNPGYGYNSYGSGYGYNSYGYRAPVQVYRPQIYINRSNNGRGHGNGHRR